MKRLMPKTEKHFQLIGWILFVLGCLVFILASLKAHDPIGLVGGILFLGGCLFFLIPLLNAKIK